MGWQGFDEQHDRGDEPNRDQRGDDESKEPVQIMPAGLASNHGGEE